MFFIVLYSIMPKPHDFIFMNSGCCTFIPHLCKLYSPCDCNLVLCSWWMSVALVCFLSGRATSTCPVNTLLFRSQSLWFCWQDSSPSSRGRYMTHTFWNFVQRNTDRIRVGYIYPDITCPSEWPIDSCYLIYSSIYITNTILAPTMCWFWPWGCTLNKRENL